MLKFEDVWCPRRCRITLHDIKEERGGGEIAEKKDVSLNSGIGNDDCTRGKTRNRMQLCTDTQEKVSGKKRRKRR